MQIYEAKSKALSAAVNLSVDGISTEKKHISAAIAYLMGKTDKTAFFKKCAKNPLYARLIALPEKSYSDIGNETFCALHKFLFEPRENSGEIRNGELMMQGGSCTDPKLLRGSLKNVLSKLQQMQSAPEISKTDFAAQLCCYVRELIILSPFSYGNGIVRRAFVQAFCFKHGFTLTYAAANKKEISSAETAAFASDEAQPLFSLYIKILSYTQEENSADKRKKLSKRLTRELKAGRSSPAQKAAISAETQSRQKIAPVIKPASLPPSVRTKEQPKPYADNRKLSEEKPAAKRDTKVNSETLLAMQKTIDTLSNQVSELLQALKESENKE